MQYNFIMSDLKSIGNEKILVPLFKLLIDANPYIVTKFFTPNGIGNEKILAYYSNY